MNVNQTEITRTAPSVANRLAPSNARSKNSARSLFGKAWRGTKLLVYAGAALMVQTPMRRWQGVAYNPEPVWDERNRVIAGFIRGGTTVLDIGCGAQSLKRYLKADCTYQPCDIVKSTPDVIVCNFNAGIFPEIERPFGYVICSGVFEYMRNPKQFLELIATYGEIILLSYHPLVHGQWKIRRVAADWVNHLSEDQLLKLFNTVGLKYRILHGSDSSELIYELRRN